MSWTDVFPVMTDEQVDHYLREISPGEDADLKKLFAVQRTIQPRAGCHLVATSLFWKNLEKSEDELPPISREMMSKADELGLVSRYAPWDHYVQPLIEGAAILRAERPDAVFRVYLAADMEFLIPDLVAAGCEIKLMESTSIRHNPGAMWRFLALEEADRWVTITDADRAPQVLHDVERTEHILSSGLGAWRVPYVFDGKRNHFHAGFYRPINASQFGGKGGLPVELLMKAFIWHGNRGSMPAVCFPPGKGEAVEIASTEWPSYGYDEWFLMAAIYPRIAFEGLLTFIVGRQPMLTCWHGLDFEYSTWANPRGELFLCPETDETEDPPWHDWKEECPLQVRPGSLVVRRARRRRGPSQRIYSEPISPLIEPLSVFNGGLLGLLGWAAEHDDRSWLIDLNPNLRASGAGAELFMDRRFEAADVVVCGCFFVAVTEGMAAWAGSHGLPASAWGVGKIVSLPKLEGPLTLWKMDFARRFLRDASAGDVSPELLLRLWIDTGKASVLNTTARDMGWEVR